MNKKIILIALLTGIVLLSGCITPPEPPEEDIPHYFIALHLDPVRVNSLDSSRMTSRYDRTVEMVQYATDHKIRLSLMFAAPLAQYISQSQGRMDKLEEWKLAGHEIGMHHHDIYHKTDWDGYTEFSMEEIHRARRALGEFPPGPRDNPEHYIGPLSEFMDIMHEINPDMDSGVANELNDKRSMPNELLYSAASGYRNFGEPDVMWDGMNDPGRGINDYAYVSEIDGRERYWVGYAHVMNPEQVEDGIETFNSMNSNQVFGAVMHNSTEREKQALFDLIDFISQKDPEGKKSLVQAEIVKLGMLPEIEIEFDECGDSVCGDYESEITCPADCEEIPIDPDNDYDADGLIIGTETLAVWDGSSQEEIDEAVDVINNVLKTKNVKWRVEQFLMERDESGNFLPYRCMRFADECSVKSDMDEVVELFKENGWNLYPIFSQMNNKENPRTLNDEYINDYANWIKWFLDRYYNEVNIVYIEPGNNPSKNWGPFAHEWEDFEGMDETYELLVKQQNLVYERIKSKYPDLIITSPGFEFHYDASSVEGDWAVGMLEYFLDSSSGAKYDGLAIHGFPPIVEKETDCPGGCLGGFCRGIPTRIPTYNQYTGVYGTRELRKKLDEEGWADREIYHTENWLHIPENGPNTEQDKLIAAFYVQDFLLRKTLQHNGKAVLSGINSMLISRISGGDIEGSLLLDGSVTFHVESIAFLWEKLREYNYDSRKSGKFGSGEVWVEKFKTGNKELYVFFKPFKCETPHSFDGETVDFELSLDKMPSNATLYDIHGDQIGKIELGQTITLEAENSPQYLEVNYE